VAKVALIVYLASWVTRLDRNVNKLTFGTIPFAVILSLSAGLVLVEPDLGTTATLVLTAASVFFIAGANVVHALLGAAAGIFLLVNVVASSGYRADRIEAFKDPWADPAGVGWHTTQALTALGSGGFSGLGLGAGRKKFEYLPNAHTDSIYAVVGEETGFVGASLVLGLFLLFSWRGLFITVAAQDPLGRALAAGATCLIGWQAFMNMAVISHVVPNTGVPLPFLSYGGSAMIVNLTAVGILLSVSRSIDPERLSWLAVLRNWRTLAGPWRTASPKRATESTGRLAQPVGR
jgi:cell division protein FtsW